MGIKNIRSFEFKLGKLGLALLIVGMGGLVFGAFVLGVSVGKDMDNYPERILRGIPRMITDSIAFVLPKGKTDGEAKAPDKAALDLTFYETLTKKGAAPSELIGKDGKGGKDDNSTPAVIVAPPVAPPPPVLPPSPMAVSPPGTKSIPPAPGTKSPPEVTTARDALAKSAASPSPSVPPPAKPDALRAAPSVAGPAASANYSIQVVSYDDQAKAKQLQKRLQEMGFKAEVSAMDIAGKGKWYRVVVNNYQTRKDAEKAADGIKQKVKGLNCIVRQGDKS